MLVNKISTKKSYTPLGTLIWFLLEILDHGFLQQAIKVFLNYIFSEKMSQDFILLAFKSRFRSRKRINS
jgi:hypothetical protein